MKALIEKNAARIIITSLIVLVIVGIVIGLPYQPDKYDPGHSILAIGDPNYYFVEDTWNATGNIPDTYLALELKDDDTHVGRLDIRPGLDDGLMIRRGGNFGVFDEGLFLRVFDDFAQLDFYPGGSGVATPNQLRIYDDRVVVPSGMEFCVGGTSEADCVDSLGGGVLLDNSLDYSPGYSGSGHGDPIRIKAGDTGIPDNAKMVLVYGHLDTSQEKAMFMWYKHKNTLVSRAWKPFIDSEFNAHWPNSNTAWIPLDADGEVLFKTTGTNTSFQKIIIEVQGYSTGGLGGGGSGGSSGGGDSYPKKFCSPVTPGNWRDSIIVADSWTISNCAEHSKFVASHYNVGCIFENEISPNTRSSWSEHHLTGTTIPNSDFPDPNCGW